MLPPLPFPIPDIEYWRIVFESRRRQSFFYRPQRRSVIRVMQSLIKLGRISRILIRLSQRFLALCRERGLDRGGSSGTSSRLASLSFLAPRLATCFALLQVLTTPVLRQLDNTRTLAFTRSPTVSTSITLIINDLTTIICKASPPHSSATP